MSDSCTPTCPWCNTAKHVRTSGTTPKAFYCAKCRIEFEAEDDGDVGYGNPEKYAQRNERHALAQRQRLGVRPGGPGLKGGLGR